MSVINEHQSSQNPKTILLVEDDIAQATYMSILLKKLKVKVIIANSGKEALRNIKNKNIDGMMFDILLGEEMSGIDLLEILRKKASYNKTPAIAVSAYYTTRQKQEFIDCGFADYIPKPITFAQVEGALKQYFNIDTTTLN